MDTKNAAVEAVEKVTRAPADPEVRVTRRIEVGHAIHQGDVYVHRVADSHPRGKPRGSRQVALGTAIGSRHVAEGDDVEVFEGERLPDGVKAPKDVPDEAILGPVVVAPRGFVLTHPEHAHHELPGGTYQVTYQADLQTMRAVAD